MTTEKLQPEKWVELYGDYLYNLAIYKISDKALAEDLVQDTFLSALKARNSFRGDSSEKTWLCSILNNKIIDFYRKKKQPESLDEYLENTALSFNSNFFDLSPADYGHMNVSALAADWGSHAESSIMRNEFRTVMSFCLSKLPEKMTPVFSAKFIEEKKSDEICKEFNITSSNFWVIMHRTKLLMRACLEKNWFLSEKINESS